MKVTVYSTATCPYCVMLKEWLDDKGVEYQEYLIDQNPYAAQMMVSQSGQRGVPFTTIERNDGRVSRILGFDRAELAAALAS